MVATIPAREIVIRRPGLAFEDLPRHFIADDVMRSHIGAMLSAVFPEGEDFFVRSVRAYRDQVTDPELKEQVKGFIGQEAIHGREHRTFNERLNEVGYPTRFVDRRVKVGLAILNKVAPKSVQLAVTAALEHYTASFAEALLRDQKSQDEFATDEIRALFTWHAMEESEHKSVAFDVFQEVSGNRAIRVGTMTAVHVGFFLAMSISVTHSLLLDRKSWRKVPKSLLGLRTHPFFQKPLRKRLWDYNRADFHPDDHETAELLAEWRKRYEDGQVVKAAS